LKCRACPNEYPEPDIIEGTAYYVCSNCGNAYEIENYRVYTTEERIEQFEKEHNIKLPEEYIRYAGSKHSWVVKLPPSESESTKYYFGEGFYQIGELSGLDPDKYRSIFDSPALVQEWKLPKDLVLIDGDGHTWLALDYRDSNMEPKVIVIESDESNHLLVANNFGEFIDSLLPYGDVYDSDGNVIFAG
jgi:DNA-directed RNA polymerase subunit M/transcription elongation factor TFIIS